MITISSLQFCNPEGFEQIESFQSEIVWHNEARQESITKHFFAKKPDIPCSLDRLDSLRDAYRQSIAGAGGGIVSLQVLNLRNLKCIEAIFKLPQEPHGMFYLGSITFPFAEFSYVIKIECPELGTTGIREAIVASKLMKSGEFTIDLESGKMAGWAADPYSPDFQGPALKNKAEDEEFDSEFPDHPLSRLRFLLAQIKSSLHSDQELYGAAPFAG